MVGCHGLWQHVECLDEAAVAACCCQLHAVLQVLWSVELSKAHLAGAADNGDVWK